MSSSLFVCRQCSVLHGVKGNYATATIEIDAETYSEISTINLVSECPDCWDPVFRNKAE